MYELLWRQALASDGEESVFQTWKKNKAIRIQICWIMSADIKVNVCNDLG